MSTPPSAAIAVLDDPAQYERLDPSRMHDAIVGLPSHIEEMIGRANALRWAAFKPTTPAGICICGMGGSAIGGDLARSYWDDQSPVPIVVVRDYRLPAYVNNHWSVIVSSYSGNTEETLAAADDAIARGCRRILALTTGGQLGGLAQEQGWPVITLPMGLMPRAALGYLFGGVMLTLARWGVAGNNPAELAQATASQLSGAAEFLRCRISSLERNTPTASNSAKSAAALIAGRVTAVWGGPRTAVVAQRIKSQLCENGKALAFAGSLTEVNHNEIVGLAAAQEAENLALIVLSSPDDDPRVVSQRNAALSLFEESGLTFVVLGAEGTNSLQRMLSLVQSGDFISYYTAILTGNDPTPITAIETLKAAMAASA